MRSITLLICIFQHSDWKRRSSKNPDRKNSKYGHFLRNGSVLPFWQRQSEVHLVRNIGGSSRLEVFCRKDVLRNFAKLTGKYLCHCLFLNKVAGLRPVTLLKKRPWPGAFLWILQNFQKHLFLQNTYGGCFWTGKCFSELLYKVSLTKRSISFFWNLLSI